MAIEVRNTVYLQYMVPVTVEVDLDDGSVWSVTVRDEQATRDPEGDYGGDAEEIAEAEHIAEDESWPAWEIG